MGRLSTFLRAATLAITAMVMLPGCGIIMGFAAVEVEVVADSDAGTFTVAGDIDECTGGTHAEKETELPDAPDVRYHEFECSDGTGSFVLRVEFAPATEAQDQESEGILEGSWTVAEGTGDYATLEGNGTVHVEFGTATVATYNGEMSNFETPLSQAG